MKIYLSHLVNIFQKFSKRRKNGENAVFVQFQSARMQHLRSWIFCEVRGFFAKWFNCCSSISRKNEMIKSYAKLVINRLFGGNFSKKVPWHAFVQIQKKIIFRRIFWRWYIFLRMNGLNLSCPEFWQYNSSRVMIAMKFGKKLTDTRIIMKFFCKICPILCDRLMIIVWIWRLRKSFGGCIGQNIITKNFKILSNRIFERRKYDSHARGSFFLDN